jgi:hypothetical protein
MMSKNFSMIVCIDDQTYTQVNAGLKAGTEFLFEFFCAAWITYSWPEKAFNGFYFAVAESIILGVADELVVGCSDIVDGERTTVLRDNFRKFNLFYELRGWKAFLFVSGDGDTVITSGACERKTISKLTGNHVPIFLFISHKISPDKFLSILRF